MSAGRRRRFRSGSTSSRLRLFGRFVRAARHSGGEGSLDDEPRTPTNAAPEDEERLIAARGILIATAGHGLVLTVLLMLDLIGISRVDLPALGVAAGVVVAVQGALWLGARTGLAERVDWDPHYVRVPMLAAAALFALYIFVAPESRYLVLMAWFVALLFTAGLEGFRVVVALGAVMTALYMGTLALLVAGGSDLSLGFEGVRAGVFLAINVYAGFVFQRIRRERAERTELREELARQAITDPLTGLPNRRYMEEFLEAELDRIDRYGGACSLAMIDVDDFKNYNDTLGHVAGDRVLRSLADVLRDELRVSDIAARYGGEEFSVIMVNSNRTEAGEAAERLRETIQLHPFPNEDIQPRGDLTVSIGIASYPQDADSYEELVGAADEALYEAKRRGKNQVRAA